MVLALQGARSSRVVAREPSSHGEDTAMTKRCGTIALGDGEFASCGWVKGWEECAACINRLQAAEDART
jgi:hypothetical protein